MKFIEMTEKSLTHHACVLQLSNGRIHVAKVPTYPYIYRWQCARNGMLRNFDLEKTVQQAYVQMLECVVEQYALCKNCSHIADCPDMRECRRASNSEGGVYELL